MPKHHPDQPELLPEEPAAPPTPEAQAERQEYQDRLRLHLQDPALRATPGFPKGSDEAILALSDPPYYTACPNPFLAEIIEQWQKERFPHPQPLSQGERGDLGYHREPFAADVSEGKNDPIYNAHSYHTKVPHKAIMRYILHYTEPGDIVLDGFCGTGMTGVAAQLCGDKKTVESLSYQVGRNGDIYAPDPHPQPLPREGGGERESPPSPLVGEGGRGGEGERGKKISKLGPRKAVLVDLSPAATFIAYNYNTPVDAKAFEREANRILKEVEKECGWMYETWHIPPTPDPSPTPGGGERPHPQPLPHEGGGERQTPPSPLVGEGGRGGEGVKGKINYTVWSDVFVCPQCGKEMVFWDVAVDQEKGEVRDDWDCPHCRARLSKSPRKDSAAQRVERAFETHFDRALGQNVRQAKQVPVLINYSVETASSRRMTGSHSHTKRYEKHPDAHDLALIAKIEDSDIPYPFPTDELPDGFNTQQPRESHGLTHVHHFYTHRNLRVLATTYAKVEKSNLDIPIKAKLRFLVSSYNLTHSTRMTRIIFKSNGNKPLLTGHQTGTLYASSLPVEKNIFWGIGGKVITVKDATLSHHQTNVILQTASASSAIGTKNSIDYIFVDPPFGANLMYSELNFLWEAWLSMFTNNTPEAIVNKIQRKGLPEYQELMEGCFREFYRLLKSGHWMTVEFHNSQNAVWNAIQEGLLRAGFMIADVRTLDKQQGSFKQVTTTAAVKQDLIISAYKPARGFEQRFLQAGGSPEAAWDFIRQHLEQLPVPQVGEDGLIETLAERQPYLLYDRMVAFHIQRGLAVPLSAPEFYQGLPQRFLERDGMIFTPAHAAEYDQRRMKAERVEQLALFVSDEKSALQWLRRELTPTSGAGPQTYGDLQPKFMQEARSIARHEQMPELRDLLEANFLHDDAGRWYLPDPGKQADLDALRQKSLLREFNTYLEGRGRLKAFRSEAVRAGFGHAWKERQYAAIVQVAERLPANVLEEDPELLMYADNARLRAGDEPKQKGLWDG